MKNNIKDFFNSILYEHKITTDQIHHVEVVYSCPDTWYTIVHKSGDKKKSLFRKMFNLEVKVYEEPIIYSRYTSKKIPMSKLVQELNDDRYIIKSDDQVNPIWFNKGIHLYYKDKYNNSKCSTIFYINEYSISAIEKFVAELNYELYKDTLEFFGYRHVDLPKINAIRYTVTDRKPVKLQCKAEASPSMMIHMTENGVIEYLKNDIIRGISESEEFKSLIKYDIDYFDDKTPILYGYIEILKDNEEN